MILIIHPEIKLFYEKCNFPYTRISWLKITLDMLNNNLLSKAKKRETYLERMAFYHSLDNLNSNKVEERMERNLVNKCEQAYTESMKRRDLTRHEIQEIQINREMELYRYRKLFTYDVNGELEVIGSQEFRKKHGV